MNPVIADDQIRMSFMAFDNVEVGLLFCMVFFVNLAARYFHHNERTQVVDGARTSKEIRLCHDIEYNRLKSEGFYFV